MNDEESIWYQKRIAVEGIRSTMLISLGIGLIAIGATLGFTEKGNMILYLIGMSLLIFGLIITVWCAVWSKEKIMDLKYSPETTKKNFTWRPHFSRSWYCQMYDTIERINESRLKAKNVYEEITDLGI